MITKEELLYFSLKHQYLLERAKKATIVSALCGLQAQFANNPKYALQIRAEDYEEADWGDGLVKIWSFRGTLHAIRFDELGLFLSARGYNTHWDDSWDIDRELKPKWAQRLFDWIEEGVDGREDLKKKCREHGMDEELLKKIFHGWGGLIREMCDRGMIAYDIGTGKKFIACKNVEFIDHDEARIKLMERYFKAFGPATIIDCATFTGYRKNEVLRLLEKSGIPLQRVLCEGVEYFYLRKLHGDGIIPDCLFLTGFDQLIMGYKDRSRFLVEKHKKKIVKNNGIVFAKFFLECYLKARWKKDGNKLLITPFVKLSKGSQKLIEKKGKDLFGNTIHTVVFQEIV